MKTLMVLGILVTAAAAQDVASGPEKRKTVPALTVFDVTGPYMGKDVDYTSKRKDLPTVYAFVQAEKWDRPMARFLVKLEEGVVKEGKDALVVAVWLTDAPDKAKEYLPRAQQSLKFDLTALTCYTKDRSGPDGWGINPDAHLTVVVAHEKKVAAVFGYISTNEKAVPEVLKAFRAAVGPK